MLSRGTDHGPTLFRTKARGAMVISVYLTGACSITNVDRYGLVMQSAAQNVAYCDGNPTTSLCGSGSMRVHQTPLVTPQASRATTYVTASVATDYYLLGTRGLSIANTTAGGCP